MKKIFIAGLAFVAAVSAQAQTLDEAVLVSENNYYGTARTIALGNAVSAVGGDLGTISINPAGSAVAGYSQFTISPGVTVSTNGTNYISPYPDMKEYYNKARKSFATMPNIGSLYNIQLNRPSGLRSISFGFVVNTTDSYNENIAVYGENPCTSQLGSFAQLANGIDRSYFDNQAAGLWDLQTAYDAYLFDYLKDVPDQYLGATENKYWNEKDGCWDIELAGPVGQDYFRTRRGTKTDILMNFGMNFNDRLYVGVNLGLPVFDYRESLNFGEYALDKELFQTGFDHSVYEDFTDYSAVGVYGKFGVIWRPVTGLRLAAAFQTPTAYTISETYGWYAKVRGSEIKDSKGNNPDAQENTFEPSYNLSTAPIYTLGAAYTIGNVALVSFDWEIADLTRMFYSQYDYQGYGEIIGNVNREIIDNNANSQQFRLGVEFKPYPELALRAGYNLSMYNHYDGTNFRTTTKRDAFSAGLGYSSNNSFFMDLAARLSRYPDYYNYPYDVYDENWDLVYASPEIQSVRRKFDVVLTFGWRF